MTEEELMLTTILNCGRADLYAQRPELTGDQKQTLGRMKQRRAQGEPLQYILKQSSFLDMNLTVDSRVLIPRSETEIMADFAIKKLKEKKSGERLRILDCGTGSGNIAIALAKGIECCRVTAMDISEEALALAKDNAEVLGVSGKVEFVKENMVTFFLEQAGKEAFDLIISNPPYIKTGDLASLPVDVQQEPCLALDGGADGLYYLRQIIMQSSYILKNDGLLIFEIGDQQRQDIENIINQFSHFKLDEFLKDYTGVDRVCAARLKVDSRITPQTSLL